MTNNVYFIGGGQMVTAMIRGLLRQGMVADQIGVTDIDAKRLTWLQENLGVRVSETPDQAAMHQAEFVVIGVRPQDNIKQVVQTIAKATPTGTVLSIVAGVSIAAISAQLGNDQTPIARVIPNTMTETGYGTNAVSLNATVNQAAVVQFLSAIGKVAVIPESQMAVFTAFGVAGPNYIYHFFRAMSNAGVLAGLSRNQANELLLENLKGAVVMLADQHPEVLLDRNNSAGGVGIHAANALAQGGFDAAISDAVLAAKTTTESLGAHHD